MKKVFFILSILSLYLTTNAQTIFEGKLILKEKEIYNYKLVLTIDTIKKTVSGYSITDEKGKEETKSLVRGQYHSKNKKIVIEEFQIESTKAKAKDVVFCFIEAELSIGMAKEDSTLIGKFTGRLFPKHEVCGTGGIFLKEIETKKKIKNPIVYVKPTPIPIKTPEIKQEEKIDHKTFELVKTSTEFSWNSDSVTIELWDQGNLDGDIVSLFVDGNLIANNIQLDAKKVTFRVAISKGEEHAISILAENEGRYPPNTAAMILYDKHKKHSLMCQSKVHEMKSIKIKR